MANTNIENNYKNLANRIYDLDTKAYESTGSSLGRHFIGSKEKNIEELVRLLTAKKQSYQLRAELASVANVIRTIKDKPTRKALLSEYNSILQELKSHDTAFESVEIINEKVAELNPSNFSNHKPAKNEHLIICISRSHSSAGNDIGFALADDLHINYYDIDVLKGILNSIDKEKDTQWHEEKFKADPNYAKAVEMAHRISDNQANQLREFSRYHGLPKEDADFFNISKFLVEAAKTEDFVVVGRCADAILANSNIPHFSIYITAPADLRAKHLMKTQGIDRFKKAMREISKKDTMHARYYTKYTRRVWGYAGNYDLCLNSSSYGIDESVEVIKRIIQKSK